MALGPFKLQLTCLGFDQTLSYFYGFEWARLKDGKHKLTTTQTGPL